MNIFEAKKIENENLKEAMKRWPRFFISQTFIDNQASLEKYGISIPEKEKLPLGYLKLWPQDFIVEEIGINEETETITMDKFLSRKKEFTRDDPIIYATLVKCGLSTIESTEELAKFLRINSENIKYAGIKDKHAITSQLISVKGGDIDKLNSISSSNFFVKNIFSGKKGIYVGKLKGNQFTILIRTGPDFKKEMLIKNLNEVEKKGFFNFFYLQRFGIPRLMNPYCGLHILKGDYEKAIFTAICEPGERELLYFQNLRKEMGKLWGNWEEIEGILQSFPLTFQNEIKLIRSLINEPNNFVGALNQIPRVVQLWLTSFAAILFNKLLSYHIQTGKNLPRTLPLVLSQEEKDWLVYKKLLNQAGIFSTVFALKNLKPFPQIILRRRDQETIERIRILDWKVIPEGVILNFNLSKGCYATTFLSHLFNLASGNLPRNFSNLPIDTKANINQQSLEEILNRFSDVISSPSWRLLWGIY